MGLRSAVHHSEKRNSLAGWSATQKRSWALTSMLAMLRAESAPIWMARLANSDGCRPPQPQNVLFQLLPRTPQPSELIESPASRADPRSFE